MIPILNHRNRFRCNINAVVLFSMEQHQPILHKKRCWASSLVQVGLGSSNGGTPLITLCLLVLKVIFESQLLRSISSIRILVLGFDVKDVKRSIMFERRVPCQVSLALSRDEYTYMLEGLKALQLTSPYSLIGLPLTHQFHQLYWVS